MLDFVTKLFGGSDRAVKPFRKLVSQVNELEAQMQGLSDSQLADKTNEFKRRIAEGETLDQLMPEAFAVVREASVRTLGMRQFDMQIIGAAVLHQGRIAEMKTGEGKTLVAPTAAYLNALAGGGVHIVTVNDYLAKYQSEWMANLFRFLGMNVGLVIHGMSSEEKRLAYAADVTYGTNNEFGFDYLRDNMVTRQESMVQRPLNFAVVDEVDSILIDEARTPLIISGDGDKSTDMYRYADQFAARLSEDDTDLDEKAHAVTLTESGVAKAEQFFKLENLADAENNELNHYINNALKAHRLMKRDRDYVVQDSQVVIVDEFTGRLMLGRRYSDGLHQAIEAKENVKVARESRTLATITFQNYFRMYKKLSGMTGTAKTEEEEFQGIYNLDVVPIPTNRPMIRQDLNDVVYCSQKGKYNAVVEDIAAVHETGQPILVGTVSVEKSEALSKLLRQRGVPHQVLNAKHHDKEADIVAQAGKVGAVTIATNMAGRGTDIMLGGNADFMARQEMRRHGMEDALIMEATGHALTQDPAVINARAEYNQLYQKYKKQIDVEHEKVVALGGLYIIGTERHESRRIDNQLRGRAGRQGDPGASRFYLALDDDLLRLFGSERIEGMVTNLGLDEDTPLELGMLSRQIEGAQKRVESRNYQIRKHVLQYDDVMNGQREIIYTQRRTVLQGGDIRTMILEMLDSFAAQLVDMYTEGAHNPEEWDLEGLRGYCERVFLPKGVLAYTPEQQYKLTKEELLTTIRQAGHAEYARRINEISGHGFDASEIERAVLLQAVDRHWMDHIDAMDELRNSVGLRAYGQKDPVMEYKFEGFEMFDAMVSSIKEDTLTMMFHLSVQKNAPQRGEAPAVTEGRQRAAQPAQQASHTPAKAEKTVGRNDPCPCGSGKKYKNCCGKNT
ncbi:MAG: preprotein translocase subunit SecA [Eubacteriales bacterium]|nr:preprotein translocase subunit SecA [Eubacteriales bacterium]